MILPLRRRVAIGILFGLTFAPTSARAGAWLPEPGAIYARTAVMGLNADARRSCRGGSDSIDGFGGTYREVQTFAYAEYGIRPWVAALGSFAVKDTRMVDGRVPEYGTRSTGDLRVGARWGILRGGWPVSVETIVSIPTYPKSDPRARVSEREQFLPAGTGSVDVELHLSTGVSLYPWPVYANASAGRRRRGGVFGDQWLLAVELGLTLERIFLKSDWRGSFADGDLCSSASAGAVTLEEQSWHWAPELAVRVADRWWAGAGASVLLGGRNVLDGTQWSLSLTWRKSPRNGA